MRREAQRRQEKTERSKRVGRRSATHAQGQFGENRSERFTLGTTPPAAAVGVGVTLKKKEPVSLDLQR